jgi:hypothetical protein
MLKEEPGKGTHQHRGQLPGQPLRIASILDLGKGRRELVAKRVKR